MWATLVQSNSRSPRMGRGLNRQKLRLLIEAFTDGILVPAQTQPAPLSVVSVKTHVQLFPTAGPWNPNHEVSAASKRLDPLHLPLSYLRLDGTSKVYRFKVSVRARFDIVSTASDEEK